MGEATSEFRTVVSPLFCLLAAVAVANGTEQAGAQDGGVAAVEYARRTIYHSPQTPGFTCWTGTWSMPEGSLTVCLAQATGPAEGQPRFRTAGIRSCWLRVRE